MKLLVFSDIHGNAYAMEAFVKMLPCLEYDYIAFLGDIFGYYYDQRECIEMLKEIPDLIWLKGNHDQYATECFKGKRNERDLIERFGHSYAKLRNSFSTGQMLFLENLPIKQTLTSEDRKILLVHGRPKDALEGRLYPSNLYISNEKEFFDYDIVIMGHTHYKMKRFENGTLLLNPGSLGQPRDGRGYGFLIFDSMGETCQFINVEVDSVRLRREIDKKDKTMQKLYDVLSREEK